MKLIHNHVLFNRITVERLRIFDCLPSLKRRIFIAFGKKMKNGDSERSEHCRTIEYRALHFCASCISHVIHPSNGAVGCRCMFIGCTSALSTMQTCIRIVKVCANEVDRMQCKSRDFTRTHFLHSNGIQMCALSAISIGVTNYSIENAFD